MRPEVALEGDAEDVEHPLLGMLAGGVAEADVVRPLPEHGSER
jgi:hypothetical protein